MHLVFCSPKLTVVVVKKRISARFFSMAGRDLANPGPGTVVDNTVTRPESYDYFVISQSVRQGTVTPTHYNVIWDESGMKPDHIQRLTYKLCHLYYNWPVSKHGIQLLIFYLLLMQQSYL